MTFCTGSKSIGPLRMLSNSVEIVLYMSQQSAAMAIPRETGVSGVLAGCTFGIGTRPRKRGWICVREVDGTALVTH